MGNFSFSKLNREQKIKYLGVYSNLDSDDLDVFDNYWYKGSETYKNLENISENVVSHHMLPFSVAPGFIINKKAYHIPMVTDESSVVASAASAAKFWNKKGGFVARVKSKIKIGQVHFNWPGKFSLLQKQVPQIKAVLKLSVASFLSNMEKRGGGIKEMEFLDFTQKIPDYFQLRVHFDTADAMGANIINTCLEAMATSLKDFMYVHFTGPQQHCDVLMSILSNYTPRCIVESTVSCDINDFKQISGDMAPEVFAKRFKQAVNIAEFDVFRAVTHNKGIFNGIDAVLLATGNDFRATEAGGHSFAASKGTYKSLTSIDVSDNIFKYTLQVPLALGTVGGLTTLHPMVRLAFKIMNKPSADVLMQIAASVGLANNFSAIRALITCGIQKGHMKFHLQNLLQVFGANEAEKVQILRFFRNKTVSYAEVEAFIRSLRT